MNIFPSYYEGMSVKLDKRFSQNLSFLINYTWSKNIDYVDSFVSAGIGGSPFSNPTRFNTSANRGLAGFDVPQRVVASYSYIYQLPVKSHNKIANAVVGNWSVTGIVSFDSGLPNFVVLTSDNENIGTVPGRFTEFPNLVGDPRAVSRRTPEKWFNTDAYALPPAFTVGNAGRRALRGPRFGNWDSSIFKRWPFQESRDVEFRSEFFNFTNHTNFGYPGVLLGTPQFGRVSSTRNPGRQVQLGLKLRF